MGSNSKETAPIVIIGAGKIGRGFIGHLVHLAGFPIVFADASDDVVEGLREQGRYRVTVVDAPEKSTEIKGFELVHARREEKRLIGLLKGCSAAFTCVGATNLPAVGPVIAAAVEAKITDGDSRPLNVVVCENSFDPSALLRQVVNSVLKRGQSSYDGRLLGIADGVVLRIAMDPIVRDAQTTPWDVDVHDYWDFPIDGAGICPPFPVIPGVRLIDSFLGLLPRKLYTSNCANATLAFLGSLYGYTYVADAAREPRIAQVLSGLYTEIDKALSLEFSVPMEEMHDMSRVSWRKLNNAALQDTLERNARDPLRKLGPNDRLVGAARIVLRHGGNPTAIATGIAAALHYVNPNDASAERLRTAREQDGVISVLNTVCGIGNEPFRTAILKQIENLRVEGIL